MIRSAWRRIAAFLGSAVFATVLLAILGVWSMVATTIPQGPASAKEVIDWAARHAGIEPIVRAFGLHQAFSNPLFIALVVALGASTALCAWQRTKVALHRAGTLRTASLTDHRSLVESHDLEVACEGTRSAPEALSIASETLGRVGIKTKRQDDMLVAISPQWTVWGSPIFHWALLGLLLALLIGNMLRAEGLMGVIVGQTKPDAAQSYGIVHTGPLHDWGRVHRSLRVDNFELDYKTGGVDRGPTPTVSLLNSAGKVIKKQRVYPNATLKSGSLTIYPSSFGLAVLVSEVGADGAVRGRGSQIVDFSPLTPTGTMPVGSVAVLNDSGSQVYRATLTVPLDSSDTGWADQMPANPTARVVVTSADGTTVLEQVVRPGETLAIPGSLGLRVDNIVYYARLQVVDDWTIPLLYAGLLVALVGLSIATLSGQHIVLATATEGPDGLKLVAKVRLWRTTSSSRSEIENELGQALGGAEKGSAT